MCTDSGSFYTSNGPWRYTLCLMYNDNVCSDCCSWNYNYRSVMPPATAFSRSQSRLNRHLNQYCRILPYLFERWCLQDMSICLMSLLPLWSSIGGSVDRETCTHRHSTKPTYLLTRALSHHLTYTRTSTHTHTHTYTGTYTRTYTRTHARTLYNI